MGDWVNPQTFSSVWERAIGLHSDKVFLRFEDSQGVISVWSYQEFDEVIQRAAGFLSEAGVKKGSAVHLALTNSPSFVAVWLASMRLGAWIVPSDPQAGETELAGHLERTLPVMGFCAASRSEVYRRACGSLQVVEVDEDDADLTFFGQRPFLAWPAVGLQDRAAVMFTSGTTGLPKGVEVTQANYAFAGFSMAQAAALGPGDRQLVVLPLFHANAQYYSFASAIWTGASVALMASFSASRFLEQAKRHEATAVSLFAAPLRMILARGGPVEGLALRHCWFAQNITPDQYATVSSWFGCSPRQLYGMTETIAAVLTDDSTSPNPASMGRATEGCVVEVQGPGGEIVAAGSVGEIVVGGKPGVTLFAGYLDDPQTSSQSFRGEWFLTGDRAYCDEIGRYFFDGRHSDVLKVAGENVSVVEVEAVLAEHPGVSEVAVVGRPDAIRDEVPVAFVVLNPAQQDLSEEALLRWCEEHLSRSKRPREVVVLEELPRTSVGKIRKYLLTEMEKSS